MKIAIAGHTHGVGKALYDYYSNTNTNRVRGYSRSNGYHIELDQDKLINEIRDVDLFISVANCGAAQKDLLIKLNTIVPNIITFGSVSTTYSDALPNADKELLEETFNKLVLTTYSSNLLLLKPSFLETSTVTNRIESDFMISSKEIIRAIDFWLENKNINKIEFKAQLTPKTIDNLKSFNIDIGKLM